MITNLKLNFDIGSDNQNGFIIGNNSLPKNGGYLPMYIPKLMSGIKKSDSKSKKKNKLEAANKLFINHPDCRPTVGKLINTKNYINVYLENGAKMSGSASNNRKVACMFPNGSIKKIYFNTNVS